MLSSGYVALPPRHTSSLFFRVLCTDGAFGFKSMSNGLKNIQAAARAAARRERVEAGLPPRDPYNDDSGISGMDLTEVDDIDAIKSAKGASLSSGIVHRPQSKSEVAPVAGIVGASALSETSSGPSHKGSTSDDVLSSVSSLSDEAEAKVLGAFVDLLLHDRSIDKIIARATSKSSIGAERFLMELSMIFHIYSEDLRDTTDQLLQDEQRQKLVAALISRKRMLASHLLVMRHGERAQKSDNSSLDQVEQHLSGPESDNNGLSDDEEPDTKLNMVGLESFLVQGNPFKLLKWQLRSLIIPDQHVRQVQESAERLLNFMFYNLWLEETFVRAYESVPNFEPWLRLRIDALAESLETELRGGSPVTEYLSTYSAYLSAQVVRRLRPKSDISCTHESEPSSHAQQKVNSTDMTSAEEVLEDTMAEKLPEAFGGDFSQKTVWTRLLSTKTFRGFFSDLSEVAYPTFFSECRKALNAQIDSQDSRTSAQSEERYLLSILAEIQWCSTRHDRELSFHIEPSDSLSWVDRLKLSIELSTGSEWSWWPLSPPPRAGSKAHVQLESLDLRQYFSLIALTWVAAWLVSILHTYSFCYTFEKWISFGK